jgi:hypothetical protein
LVVPGGASPAPARPVAQAINPDPPIETVKLIFIHHSCGENWLADGNGGLGIALRDNNYFVSDTNYGWGPDSIGDYTDIGRWWTWFRGPSSSTYLSALYAEFGQHSTYSRLTEDPGGENQIIMFKSCFPNSNLQGDPDDPVPPIENNPLRDQDSGSEYHTVANARGIYNDLLNYFATRQDKLFVVVTAPPVQDDTWAGNARAFNTWLVQDWLDGYPYHNVAVFDFYNVLTSNGGNWHTNDLGWDTGNHHRCRNGAIEYITNQGADAAAYPNGGSDDHPSAAGNKKATGEFVPLLNVYYNRWQSGTAPSLTLTAPTGSTAWPINSPQQIRWTTTGTVSHVNLSYSTDGFATSHDIATAVANTGSYTWTTPVTPTTSMQVRVADTAQPITIHATSATFTLYDPSTLDHSIHLPLVLRSFTS